jgi:hypothetical protein
MCPGHHPPLLTHPTVRRPRRGTCHLCHIIMLGWTKGSHVGTGPPLPWRWLIEKSPPIPKEKQTSILSHLIETSHLDQRKWSPCKPLSQEGQRVIEDYPVQWTSGGFSTHLLYLPPVCKWWWAPALLLGAPSAGPILHNKPCADIWAACPPPSIPHYSFISNT